MSLLNRVFSGFSGATRNILTNPTLTQTCTNEVSPGGIFSVFTRNIIRIHFPRPNEVRRIKRHGYKARLKTPEGRRVLMNRILKGRFVISH